MLLLFKTNDCLRHAERAIGAGVNSFLITLRYCLTLLDQEAAEQRRRGESLRLKLAVWLLRYLSDSPLLPRILRLLSALSPAAAH